MVRCAWTIAWVGQCRRDAAEGVMCPEHAGKVCRCGKPAVKECSNTGGLVCGEPLCGTCGCSWGGRKTLFDTAHDVDLARRLEEARRALRDGDEGAL